MALHGAHQSPLDPGLLAPAVLRPVTTASAAARRVLGRGAPLPVAVLAVSIPAAGADALEAGTGAGLVEGAAGGAADADAADELAPDLDRQAAGEDKSLSR